MHDAHTNNSESHSVELSFSEQLNAYDARKIDRLDVIPGRVIRLDKHGVWIDLGAKTEGLVRPEKARNLEINRRACFEIESETEDGIYIVSPTNKRPWSGNSAWSQARAGLHSNMELLVSGVRRPNADPSKISGVTVTTPWGMEAFVPAPQLRLTGRALLQLVGKKIWVRIIEVDQRTRNIIASQIAVINAHHQYLLENSHQVTSGVLTSFQSYGAFFDIGFGVSGLLIYSNIPRNLRTGTMAHHLEIGQTYAISAAATPDGKFLLSLREENLKLSNHGRQCWSEIQQLQKSGQTVEVTINALVPPRPNSPVIGLNATICGLRGFIPATHAPRGINLRELLNQKVKVVIHDANPDADRLILCCLKPQQEEREQQQQRFLSELAIGQTLSGTVTRTTTFGAFVLIGDCMEGLVRNHNLPLEAGDKTAQQFFRGRQKVEVRVSAIDTRLNTVTLTMR